MSLQFRSTTQREPTAQAGTTMTSAQNNPTKPQMQNQRPPGITASQDSTQGRQSTMAYLDPNDRMRGRATRQDLPTTTATDRTRSRTLRPQRRSFDNISDISNQPDVGSGSDIGGRDRAPPTPSTGTSTAQPPTMRRPTVFYPAARLAPSRQTYTVRKRSQSQGMSTDNLLEKRHRSPHNPESDSEYSSSELSTSTQATTVASDDESISWGAGFKPNKTSHRPSLSQAIRQSDPREQTVQYLGPRLSSQFDPNPRGSSLQFSPRESTVQFSEPLESSVHFQTPSRGTPAPTPRQRDAQSQSSKSSQDFPAAPQPPRPDRLSDTTQTHRRQHSEASTRRQPLPVSVPVETDQRNSRRRSSQSSSPHSREDRPRSQDSRSHIHGRTGPRSAGAKQQPHHAIDRRERADRRAWRAAQRIEPAYRAVQGRISGRRLRGDQADEACGSVARAGGGAAAGEEEACCADQAGGSGACQECGGQRNAASCEED
ncbi:hypothetical protein BR93DRAFT_181613 [Coniochaeta sp. PMI_546]|nr:hypothetical protein BR93DRAFT_181613 [Coniochaeta sp. PMI_546]